jgi:hypothetical protein
VGRGFAHAHELTLRNRSADHLVVAAIRGVTANFEGRLNPQTDLPRG